MTAYENLNVWNAPPGSAPRMRHLQRYHFAARWACGHVLDAGCGYGLGSWMMAHQGATHVLGADRDEAAIAAAQHQALPTAAGQVRFLWVPDLQDPAALDGMRFDTLVALEFLEHLPDPTAFLAHWQERVWRLILAVPGIPSAGRNPFHLHDLHDGWVERHFPTSAWTLMDFEAFHDVKHRPISLCYAFDARR